MEEKIDFANILELMVDSQTRTDGLLFDDDATEGFNRENIAELVDDNGTEIEDGMILFMYTL